MPTPEVAVSKTNDDLSQVEENIDTLFNTYIRPIEEIRSNARPPASIPTPQDITSGEDYYAKDFKSITVDEKSKLESRAHAFYRSLGMPVVSKEGGYYTPGWSPDKDRYKDARKSVDSSFYKEKELVNFIYKREELAINNYFIFSSSPSELQPIVYSLLSRQTFPFAVLNENATEHLEIDKQSISMDSRDLAVFKVSNPDFIDEIDSYVSKFKNVSHPIKPFIVDPRIENVVTPSQNKICVPFLKVGQNKNGVSELIRPGLEGIIRLRLQDSELDADYLKNIENILNKDKKNKATSNIDYQTLAVSVTGLLEDAKLPDDLKNFTQNKIKGASAAQFNTIVFLTKTIKTLVIQLAEAQKALDEITASINWVPIPPSTGPGGTVGWKVSSSFSGVSLEKEAKIKELKIKKITAEKSSKDFENLGKFICPFIKNTYSDFTKNYDKQLKQLTQYNAEVAEKGFLALKDIEVIKGEISGLGLIDILAVYYGLFSIDIKHLLFLIDDQSIFRLWENFPEFRGLSSVSERFDVSAGSDEVLKALFELEKKVFFILNFADKFYQEYLTPKKSTNSSA
jgi:hypothetical protein